MELIKFLQKAQAESITTVADLITAVNNGSCDPWESYQALDRMEALSTTAAGGVRARKFYKGRK